jgi:hypothetical protein
MDMKDVDMTVVAFVRDLGKANWALFDESLVPRYVKKNGPELQLVIGDLVPPQELAGFADRVEERDWKRRAKSASKFYGNRLKDYDNREYMPESNEALEEAIQGATTIISCVGAVRLSNVWTDYICFWRLFQRDASKWCKDKRHPFYVHYQSTRKALDIAEREQLKRDQAKKSNIADDNEKEDAASKAEETTHERIRFIRISDLVLSQQPWRFIPVLANMCQSMVFRYQDMAERILEESPLVDTIILRPGDLTDEDRVSADKQDDSRPILFMFVANVSSNCPAPQDTDITYLQVCESGVLPYPAVVNREDVAALAVASAMFQLGNVTTPSTSEKEEPEEQQPFHMTLGVRWCGEIDPPHAGIQGNKHDGTIDAQAGLQKVLLGSDTTLRRKRRRTVNPNVLRKFAQKLTRRRLKPYALFVAIPVYIMLALMMSSLLPYVPGFTERMIPVLRDGVLLNIRETIKGASTAAIEKIPDVRRWISLGKSESSKFISI